MGVKRLNKIVLSVLLIILLLSFGCTSSDTFIINNVKDVNGDLNITGNLTVDGNFFNKMPHLFGISDNTQSMVAINTWQEVDFNYLLGDAYGFSPDGNCILVEQTGHYMAVLEVHIVDDSANPVSNGAIRITQNGLEVSGSYSEITFDKQSAEREITTFGYIKAFVGDKLCMEWIGSDIDIRLFESNTWADQPVVAKGFINWIHPDGM